MSEQAVNIVIRVSAFGLLVFVDMNSLRPLPKKRQRNQFNSVMTDGFSKLTGVVHTSKTSSTHMANIFLDSCMVPFGLPEFVLMEH